MYVQPETAKINSKMALAKSENADTHVGLLNMFSCIV